MQGRCVIASADDAWIAPTIGVAFAISVFKFGLHFVFKNLWRGNGEGAIEGFDADVYGLLH